jgi:hypothetical protein
MDARRNLLCKGKPQKPVKSVHIITTMYKRGVKKRQIAVQFVSFEAPFLSSAHSLKNVPSTGETLEICTISHLFILPRGIGSGPFHRFVLFFDPVTVPWEARGMRTYLCWLSVQQALIMYLCIATVCFIQ